MAPQPGIKCFPRATVFWSTGLVCLAVVATVHAADFEGVISATTSFKQASGVRTPVTVETRTAIRGTQLRMDAGSGRESDWIAIGDFSANQLYALIPERRLSMALTVPDPSDVMKAPADPTAHKLIKTGRVDHILGYLVEEFVETFQGGDVTETWVTKELGVSPALLLGLVGVRWKLQGVIKNEFTTLTARLAEAGYMPLLMRRRDHNGKLKFQSEVTQVEKRPIHRSAFEVPDGYRAVPFSVLLPLLIQGLELEEFLGRESSGTGVPHAPKNRESHGGRPAETFDMEDLVKGVERVTPSTDERTDRAR